jgi:hypothetical protein
MKYARGALLAASMTSAGCPCFVAGTTVRTPSGRRRIEDLEVGDAVLGHDPDTGETRVCEVLALHRNEVAQVFALHAGDFFVPGVTEAHPFWCPERRTWRPAGELRVGDPLAVRAPDGGLVTRAVTERTPIAGRVAVYNLTVSDTHTYFAGDILVHNKSPVIEIVPFETGRFDTGFRGEGSPLFQETYQMAVDIPGLEVDLPLQLVADVRMLQGRETSANSTLNLLFEGSPVGALSDDTVIEIARDGTFTLSMPEGVVPGSLSPNGETLTVALDLNGDIASAGTLCGNGTITLTVDASPDPPSFEITDQPTTFGGVLWPGTGEIPVACP